MSTTDQQERPLALVTGAAGMVGRQVLTPLSKHYRLRATDLHALDVNGFSIESVDLTDAHAVRAAAQGCDTVFHLGIARREALRAAGSHDKDELDHTEIEVNCWGTRNVWEAAAAAKVRRVVFMSSLTIQMGWSDDRPIGAETPPRPRNHYAVTKLYGEQLAELYARQGAFTAVCLRLGQPYPVDHFGPEQIKQDGWRTLPITFPDIARGLIAAAHADLTTDTGCVTANLISDSDEPLYDTSTMRLLGYSPRDRFTAKGVVPA